MHIFVKFYYICIFTLLLSSRFIQLNFIFCWDTPWCIRVYLYADIQYFGCTKVQSYIDNEYVILASKMKKKFLD